MKTVDEFEVSENLLKEKSKTGSPSAEVWISCMAYRNISLANSGLDYANLLLC